MTLFFYHVSETLWFTAKMKTGRIFTTMVGAVLLPGHVARTNARVSMFMKAQFQVCHDNVRGDRQVDDVTDEPGNSGGGSIANINSDGTFTHVEEFEELGNWH
jgi:hypothetical protein